MHCGRDATYASVCAVWTLLSGLTVPLEPLARRGFYQAMSRAWEARWGDGFKSEQEMVEFMTSLDDADSQTSEVRSSEVGPQGVGGALRRWLGS